MASEQRSVDVEAIRARRAASTQGAWGWFGNMKFNDIVLATQRGGRKFVMQFWRWGMQNAQPVFQSDHLMRPLSELMKRGELTVNEYSPHTILDTPHPDMRFIASAAQDVDDLLAAYDDCRAQLAAAEEDRDTLKKLIALQDVWEGEAIHDITALVTERKELRTRAERAEQIVATVQEALTSALDWVPVPLVACRGDKCREQNCESCYGDEYAEEAVERSQKCRDSIVAALRSLSTTRDGQGEG